MYLQAILVLRQDRVCNGLSNTNPPEVDGAIENLMATYKIDNHVSVARCCVALDSVILANLSDDSLYSQMMHKLDESLQNVTKIDLEQFQQLFERRIVSILSIACSRRYENVLKIVRGIHKATTMPASAHIQQSVFLSLKRLCAVPHRGEPPPICNVLVERRAVSLCQQLLISVRDVDAALPGHDRDMYRERILQAIGECLLHLSYSSIW